MIVPATLLFSATAAFASWQEALNKIYQVEATTTKGIWVIVFNRLLSYAMLLIIGLLLIVSLLVEIALNMLSAYLQQILTHYSLYLLRILQTAMSFGMTTLLFALIYKYLPDVKIKWSRIWHGSLLTAAFFTMGKSIIGFYIGQSNLIATYGTATSIVTLLVWVNYSAWILFIGAEYIDVSIKRRHEKIEPAHYAQKILYIKRKKPNTNSESVL